MPLGNLGRHGDVVSPSEISDEGFDLVCNGGIIAALYLHNPMGLAKEVARLVEGARSHGFRLGQAHVREALGLET